MEEKLAKQNANINDKKRDFLQGALTTRMELCTKFVQDFFSYLVENILKSMIEKTSTCVLFIVFTIEFR